MKTLIFTIITSLLILSSAKADEIVQIEDAGFKTISCSGTCTYTKPAYTYTTQRERRASSHSLHCQLLQN